MEVSVETVIIIIIGSTNWSLAISEHPVKRSKDCCCFATVVTIIITTVAFVIMCCQHSISLVRVIELVDVGLENCSLL